MDSLFLLLVIVVATALAFDFTNGFHDTANATATTIATGALPPRVAVAVAGVCNFVGAFISLEVTLTIAEDIVSPVQITLGVVFAALIGAIAWNLATWYFGLPSSSSHALIGGIVGSALVSSGVGAVNAYGVLTAVSLPAIVAPLLAAAVAAAVTFLAYLPVRGKDPEKARRGYRWGQIGSGSLVALAPVPVLLLAYSPRHFQEPVVLHPVNPDSWVAWRREEKVA